MEIMDEDVKTKGMSREEWLAARRSGIGGSDAAAILGLSPWATPLTVWLDKTGRSAPKEETEAMRIGTELEAFVARRYEQETGRRVQRFNRMVRRGRLLGNFDRLVVPEGAKVASHMGEVRTDTLLECKTSSREWEDGVPLHYQTQVQHYMGLAPQLAHADVACLFLGRKHFEVFRVERDDAAIAEMAGRLEAWWERYVEGDVPPPPSSEADCRILWARSNPGKTVTASAEVEEAVGLYRALAEESKRIEARLDEVRGGICAAMGDAEILARPDGRPLATWKSTKDRTRTDWQGLAERLGATPEQVAEATSAVAGARRFLVKASAAA